MLTSIPLHSTYMKKKGVQYTCCSLVKELPPSKEFLPPSTTFGPTNNDISSLQCWVQFHMSLYVLERERCPVLGLPDKLTPTPKVFNSGFRDDTKSFQCWLQCSSKKKQQTNKQKTMTFQFFNVGFAWQTITDTKILQFWLERVFNPGFTDLSCWIQSHYILVFKVGLQDKPTLTLQFQCWLQCSTTKHKPTMTFQVHFQYWVQSHITILTWKDPCPT